MDPSPYQTGNNHSPGQETPQLFTESEDSLPFIYKTNSMHKLQTYLKVWSFTTTTCFSMSVRSSRSSNTKFRSY